MQIRQKDKELIIELAKQSIKIPVRVIAFGSRVNGESHECSDLDLVVKADSQNKIDIQMLQNFKTKLKESNLPIFVQVMDWYRIPKSFQENILKANELLAKV